MRITLSIPDSIVSRFFAVVPNRKRSAVVSRLIETELTHYEKKLEAACLSANKDRRLNQEIDEWQSFDDNLEGESK